MCRKFVFICLICLFSLVYLQQAGAACELEVTVKDRISKLGLTGVVLHGFDLSNEGQVGFHETTGLFGRAILHVQQTHLYRCTINFTDYDQYVWGDWMGYSYCQGNPTGKAFLYLNPQRLFNTTIRVVDAIGTQAHPLPLSNVEVQVYNQEEPLPDLVGQGFTDANGYFNLPRLSAASYSCTLTKAGFQPSGGTVPVERNTVPTGDCITDICFQMNIATNAYDPLPIQQCCLNTTITVMDAADHAIKISGAAVSVRNSGSQEQLPPGVTTNSEGKIILPMLNIERYYYTISRASFATKTGWFDNIAGENPVNVYMQRN